MQATEKIWMNGELVPWDDARIHVLTHTLHYLLEKVRSRLGNPEAVEVIHGAVVGAVAARRSCAARIEDELACGGERRFGLRVEKRHREGVVNEADGVAIIALQPPADLAQPAHMHRGGEQCEHRH